MTQARNFFSARVYASLMVLFTALAMACVFSACKQHKAPVYYEVHEDFNGCKVGSLIGAPYEDMLKNDFKDLQWRYYEDISTGVLALFKGDVDAFVTDSPVAEYMAALFKDKAAVFPKLAATCNFSLILQKNGVLRYAFEPSTVPMVYIGEDQRVSGLGIFMVKKSMDNVTYTYRDNRNVLTLDKLIEG